MKVNKRLDKTMRKITEEKKREQIAPYCQIISQISLPHWYLQIAKHTAEWYTWIELKKIDWKKQ